MPLIRITGFALVTKSKQDWSSSVQNSCIAEIVWHVCWNWRCWCPCCIQIIREAAECYPWQRFSLYRYHVTDIVRMNTATIREHSDTLDRSLTFLPPGWSRRNWWTCGLTIIYNLLYWTSALNSGRLQVAQNTLAWKRKAMLVFVATPSSVTIVVVA